MMRHEHLLEPKRIGGRTGLGFQIAFIKRQRIVGERNTRDIGVNQREFFRRQRRQLDIVRTGAGRASQDENLGRSHLRLRSTPASNITERGSVILLAGVERSRRWLRPRFSSWLARPAPVRTISSWRRWRRKNSR